jgi:hypothetical protein
MRTEIKKHGARNSREGAKSVKSPGGANLPVSPDFPHKPTPRPLRVKMDGPQYLVTPGNAYWPTGSGEANAEFGMWSLTAA